MRLSGYGFFQAFWLFVSLVYTRLFFSKARIVRLPFFLRQIGVFEVGVNFSCGYFNRVDVFRGAHLTIGDNFQMNDSCHIACAEHVVIGDDVLIASRVFISDHDHRIPDIGQSPLTSGLDTAKVSIGSRVWLGEGVCILKGVTIGDDVVVGANSVVTKDIPSGTVCVGAPARIIKHRL